MRHAAALAHASTVLLGCLTPTTSSAWPTPFRHDWTALERQSFDFGNNPTAFDDPHELAL